MSTLMRYLLALVTSLAGPGRTPSSCLTEGDDVCYVSTTGSDSAAGTSSSPWRTLQFAVDTIGPGDTIKVLPGAHAGFRIRVTGTQARRKTIRAVCRANPPAGQPNPASCNVDDPFTRITSASPASRHGSHVEVEQNVADDPAGNVIGHWVVDGLLISGSPRYGIDARVTEGIDIVNNVVENSAKTGIFAAHSDHVLVQNNESQGNGEHGIYCSDSSHFPVIRGNYLHDNDDSGIHMNGGLGTGPGDGIIQYPLVEDNEIAHNGKGGGAAINCDGVHGGLIRNNMAYGNRASGIALFQNGGAIASSYNRIYNNTIVMASRSRWVVYIPKDGQSGGVHNHFENNILYTPDPTKGSISVYSTSSTVLTSDHNIVADRFNTDGERTDRIITLGQWRQSTRQDVSSTHAPLDLGELFVDPARGDYHIWSNPDVVPACNNGTSLFLDPDDPLYDPGTGGNAVPDDFDGDPRAFGEIYIGADDIAASELEVPR